MAEENLKWFGGSRTRVAGSSAQSLFLDYGVALFSVVLASIISFLLRSYLEPTPTPLFFAAVMVSAWYGGLGPGIIATVLSTLAINYFLVEPIYSFSVPNLGTFVRLGVFVMAAILINSLNEAQSITHRKAEANLKSFRASEARFGCLAESNIIGMLVAELDGEILEANDRFLQMVGYTREELRSGRLCWLKMTPPESLQVSDNAVQELLLTGACVPFEKEYFHKNGSRVAVLHGAVMSGEKTVTGFVLDLSERKRAEAIQQEAMQRERLLYTQVQAANRQLEMILASINDQFLVLDLAGRYIYVSDRVVEVVGKSREDLLGQCMWELFPTLINSLFYTEVQRATAEQKILQFEYYYAPWQRWFENRIYPSSNSVSILVTDISERKQVQEALRQSESRFQVLVSNMPGMVYRYVPNLGSTGTFTYVSAVSRELLELEPEAILQDATVFLSLIHPDDKLAFETSVTIAVENLALWHWEGRLITPSGQLKWIQGRSRPERTPQGVVWDGLLFDITDRRQAELEREELLIREKVAREQAEAANRIKDEFLAVLSHELRSPLNPILGWSTLLQKGNLTEGASRRALATIERNAKLQTQLIDDLLDVSRILRGKMALNISPTPLGPVVESALETVRLAAEAKQIQIQTTLNLSKDQVLGDPTRLQQIVWNLLSNAIKFTPEGGRVSLRLEEAITLAGGQPNQADLSPSVRPSRYAQIIVQDTGKGINPNFLPYIFDYFRQEDGTTTRKFGGLGLGLAIVRHLTELHGGTVQGGSLGEGQGATFIVCLPLIEATGKLEATTISAQCQDFSQIRILIVDDDADMRDLAATALKQQQAEVTVATSADAALRLLQQHPFDILISDIGMPEVDGYALIRQVRSLPLETVRDIPAIALTAYASEADQQQALTAGFQKHLPKPVEPEILIHAISELMT